MPSELADAARNLGFPSDEIAGVERKPAVWVVEQESGARRLTVAGLAKLSVPPGAILNDLRNRNGLLQSEAIRQAGLFSAPPLPADVAEYRLPEGDLEALSDCEFGNCNFRLRALGVEAFSEIDWSAPNARERADALARERLLDFIRNYQESGREALKDPFVDKEEPLAPGKGTPGSYARGARSRRAEGRGAAPRASTRGGRVVRPSSTRAARSGPVEWRASGRD
jgi:hypothetical protein